MTAWYCDEELDIGRPIQVTVPCSGRNKPLATRSNVVLPVPLGPEICSNSRGPTLRLKPLST